MLGRSLARGLVAFAAVLMLGVPAHAQSTKAQINTQINTIFPDNTIGGITPQGLRTVTSNIVNSIMPTAPVVGGHLACFSGTTGLLQDCGASPGISPDGLIGCVRDGVTDCTAGVVAAAAAAAAAGLPLRLSYPGGYCIKPIQFGGSSPPGGVSLATLPFGIVADSPLAGFVSCSSAPTGNALVTITNYNAGNTIVDNFTMGPLIVAASANDSYALQLYGSIYSNITATLRGGSVASFYARADADHVVINNSWNINFDIQTPGISALMQTTDGASNGIALAANKCWINNPYGTASGDVVKTDYMNDGCTIDAESSANGYGINLGHMTYGTWFMHTEGNALGGVNGTASTQGLQLFGSSQDGVAGALQTCTTCMIDIWNNTSSTQIRNLGAAVGQSFAAVARPGVLAPSSGVGWFGADATNGAQIAGNGGATDVAVLNSTGAIGCALPHASALWNCSGFQLNGVAPSNHIMVGDGSAYRDSATLPSAALPTVPVTKGGTGLTSGTSGGIPYFSSSTTIASSGLLAANALVVGGGAGGSPATTTTGTGVLAALGVNTGSAGAFVVNGGAGGTPSSITLTNATGTASGLTAGTATNAVNTGITDDTTTNALVYPTWATANTGNLPQKVTSTKLTFNPSTGNLFTTQATIANGSTTQGLAFQASGGSVDALIYEGSGGVLGIKMGVNNALNITNNANSTIVDYNVSTANALTINPALVYWANATSDAGATDATLCRRTSNGQILTGTGASGICLGTSSARFKHDIAELRSGLPLLTKLDPKTFRYNEGYGDSGAFLQYGFIAEEVIKAVPTLARRDEQGRPSSVDMLAMVPILVKSVQELKAKSDDLEAELRQVRSRARR